MQKENKRKITFTSKICVYILFGIIVALQLAGAIILVCQEKNKIHWMLFTFSIVLSLTMTGSFIFFYFKKIAWMRIFISIDIFLECVYTIAYSFMTYPKSPGVSYASFVMYLIYGCLTFAIFITSLVLHAHLNKERDAIVLKALIIEAIIFTISSAVFYFYCCAQLFISGYTAALLLDMFSYITCCLTIWYVLHIETISLPLTFDKYYKEIKVKK